MAQYIAEFWSHLRYCNVALFFCAGHGVQVNGVDYIISMDASISNQDKVCFEAMSVTDMVAKFEEFPENTNIVILDACRDIPFRSWVRGSGRGFSAVNLGSVTIISFATSESATASDGTGNIRLFTKKLVNKLKNPIPIETVFKHPC